MPNIMNEMKDALVAHGLWPEEAERVMEYVAKAPENEPMEGRWTDSFDDYPPAIKNLAWMSVRRGAIEWLKANKPSHFALLVMEGS